MNEELLNRAKIFSDNQKMNLKFIRDCIQEQLALTVKEVSDDATNLDAAIVVGDFARAIKHVEQLEKFFTKHQNEFVM